MLRRNSLVILFIILTFSFVVAAEDLQQYLLGSGDMIEITVWNHPELTQKVTVRPDGKISLMFLGEVAVTGMTPDGLAQQIVNSLKTIIISPQVNVSVIQFKQVEVTVLGAVMTPGVFQVKPTTRLLEILAMAGVDYEQGLLEEVSLTRNSNVIKINVEKLLLEGGHQNYALQPGDVVFVPEVVRRVYILGEVNKPGSYIIDKGVTPADVLAMAGGPTKRANLEKVTIIHRLTSDGVEIINLKSFLKQETTHVSALPQLKDGDIIQITETRSIDWEKVFFFAAGIKTIHDLIVNW